MQVSLNVIKSGYQPIDCCKSCGDCCKGIPGSYFPADFNDLSVENLAQMMRDKKIAVDWWEGDPRPGKYEINSAYFLRPRTKNHRQENSPIDPSWGGECSNLTSEGCSLSFNERPAECRHLKPDSKANCKGDKSFDKQTAAIAWIPFHTVILKAVNIAEGDD